jgi:proline iminopeptidase
MGALLEPVTRADKPETDLLKTYAELLSHPDPGVRGPAATAWATSEAMCVGIRPRPEEVALLEDPAEAYTTARIEHHCFSPRAWLQEGRLLSQAARLRGIPIAIVQGRCDILSPPVTALELGRALPEAHLEIVDAVGHAFDQAGIVDALIRATDRFADAAPRRASEPGFSG